MPDVYLSRQEKERAIIKFLSKKNYNDIDELKLLEIGCGNGINLLQFIELGFKPENITGNDLLIERVTEARKNLPDKVNIVHSNAIDLSIEKESHDLVYQSTVFTSILDDKFKLDLAKKMWELVKPGGYVLWYDFIYDNPFNKDVKGIPLREIKKLFPDGKLNFKKLTLCPPLARIVTKIHPVFYTFFNKLIFLRTHILCWIEKS